MIRNPNDPVASKVVWTISAIAFLLSISSFIAITLTKSELFSIIRFSSSNNLIVESFAANNQVYNLKLPFYIYEPRLIELFEIRNGQKISLTELRSQLTKEIADLSDQEWLRFTVLDESENHLKLYCRYCREFLKNPDYFPNSQLTSESAKLFIQKFEIIESTQLECNALTRTFFMLTAVSTVFLLSAILMLIAACRILKHGIIETYEEPPKPTMQETASPITQLLVTQL